MTDLPQILLLIVIIAISIILTVIGIQIISLLREAKVTLARADRILSDLEFLTHSITRSGSRLAGIAEGLQSGVKLVESFSKILVSKSKKS